MDDAALAAPDDTLDDDSDDNDSETNEDAPRPGPDANDFEPSSAPVSRADHAQVEKRRSRRRSN